MFYYLMDVQLYCYHHWDLPLMKKNVGIWGWVLTVMLKAKKWNFLAYICFCTYLLLDTYIHLDAYIHSPHISICKDCTKYFNFGKWLESLLVLVLGRSVEVLCSMLAWDSSLFSWLECLSLETELLKCTLKLWVSPNWFCGL